MNDPLMSPEIWPTEYEVSSEELFRNFQKLRSLRAKRLIQNGVPGIQPPTDNL